MSTWLSSAYCIYVCSSVKPPATVNNCLLGRLFPFLQVTVQYSNSAFFICIYLHSFILTSDTLKIFFQFILLKDFFTSVFLLVCFVFILEFCIVRLIYLTVLFFSLADLYYVNKNGNRVEFHIFHFFGYNTLLL